MKAIKKFLRKLDIFGVNLNFKYKSNDIYTTSIGGLFIVLFFLISLSFGIYYFIPFIKRKNLNIIYYTMNIPKTETIKLKESEAAFSIGFECDPHDNYTTDDLFTFDSRYVIYSKDVKGIYNKIKTKLTYHFCKYEDFYNKYNKSLDYLSLNKKYCLDDNGHTIEGIFSDQIFSYYEFSVTSKSNTKENFDKIYEYLSQSDCKLVMYYTDITIDLSDYKEPIKPFMDSIFIQLNPILDIKRNVYFMNQYLFDDDFLFAVFEGDEKPKEIQTLFSRYEDYSLFKGLNWDKTNNEYAKIFIRADTKKTHIKRTYQKIMEFYADSSSLLIALYQILIIIFSFIDNFYAEHSIIKNLFFFKELKNKKFDISHRYNQIIELSKIIGVYDSKNLETMQADSNPKNLNLRSNAKKNTNKRSRKNSIVYIGIDKEKPKELDLNEYNNKNYKNNVLTNERLNPISSIEDQKKEEKNQIKNKYWTTNKTLKRDMSKKTTIIISETNEPKKDNPNDNKKLLLFKFNIFEIFISSLCFSCIKGNLKLKSQLNNKANEILYYKLDIVYYVRNMLLFDIINDTMLGERKKSIINLLSRPLISIYNNNIEKDIFYQKYTENDFDNFYEGLLALNQKYIKEEREEKLLHLAKNRIKELL